MISKLKKIVAKKGIVKVTQDLNYMSTSTIAKWIQKGKIPNCRKNSITAYIKEKK